MNNQKLLCSSVFPPILLPICSKPIDITGFHRKILQFGSLSVLSVAKLFFNFKSFYDIVPLRFPRPSSFAEGRRTGWRQTRCTGQGETETCRQGGTETLKSCKEFFKKLLQFLLLVFRKDLFLKLLLGQAFLLNRYSLYPLLFYRC